MTPSTDPSSWPEHKRFECISGTGTKHTVIVRKEPTQRAGTLDGRSQAGNGHVAYFISDGTPLNPVGQDPTEFSVYGRDEILRKV